VEAEFLNLVRDEPTRYDYYKCRLAAAGALQCSCLVVLLLLAVGRLMLRGLLNRG